MCWPNGSSRARMAMPRAIVPIGCYLMMDENHKLALIMRIMLNYSFAIRPREETSTHLQHHPIRILMNHFF